MNGRRTARAKQPYAITSRSCSPAFARIGKTHPESDPASLIGPVSADQVVTWPVSTRINKPENDDDKVLKLLKYIRISEEGAFS